MRRLLSLLAILSAGPAPADGPPGVPKAVGPAFDLLIRGGRVLDPKARVDAMLDVAIAGGRIARVAPAIATAEAKQVIDATGLVVVPGLVDIHAHVFLGTQKDAYLSDGFSAVAPDAFMPRTCVTTVADAGGAGWRNLPQFKEQVADRAATRVLAWLNIVGNGMKGGPIEQDLADMDARLTALRIKEFAKLVIGVKVAHFEGPHWEPVDRAVEAGRQAGVPVMVDFGISTPPLSLDDLLLRHLRPGDVYTHVFTRIDGRMPVVENGRLQPFVLEARRRGVLFDVGHGGRSFSFEQAVPALAQGLLPDSISTDLHGDSMNAGMKDLLNVMSKLMALGVPFEEVVRLSTSNPAHAIQRDELGGLGVGAAADVAILGIRQGHFGFVDATGAKLQGTQKLECEMTLRDGKVLWDLNGLGSPAWK
jgi:dihydroorotase